MSATPEARQVVGWSQTGFVRRACSDEMNRRNTHVEASPEVPQDAGSIPAASTDSHLQFRLQVAIFMGNEGFFGVLQDVLAGSNPQDFR